MSHLNPPKSSGRPTLRCSKEDAHKALDQRIQSGAPLSQAPKGLTLIDSAEGAAWHTGNKALLGFIFDDNSVVKQYPTYSPNEPSGIRGGIDYLRMVKLLVDMSAEYSEGVEKKQKKETAKDLQEILSRPLPHPDTSEAPLPPSRPIKILFLTANPTDTSRLRLDEESRAIDLALRQAEFRDRFEIQQHWAVRVSELQSYLLRHKPDIVHFSGHGSELGQIILEDDFGNSQPVSERALSTLFSVLRDNIRCVLLNACYSERQARAIAQHIDCVVGMSAVIEDRSAISFAAAFYQALGYGRDVKTAFELGCVQIDMENLDDQDVPKLLAIRTDPAKIVFALSN